jgi:hypothetical protein
MKKLTIGLSALALAAVGTTAHAQHYGNRSNPDANGDGVITRAEAQAHAGQMFGRMDANHDGKLDQADREARRAEFRAKMFAKLDANNDGSISRSEFMAFEPGGRGDKGGDHRRMGHGDGGPRGMMMKMADTNNDGAISQAEFTAAALKHFDAMDANHDGTVTQEERQAAREQMRGKWHERMNDQGGS